MTAAKGEGQRWNQGVRAKTVTVDPWQRGGMNEWMSLTFIEHLLWARNIPSPLYISSHLIPTLLPGGSYDNPRFTDEKTEARRDDLAQGHIVNQQQSLNHCGISENSLSPTPCQALCQVQGKQLCVKTHIDPVHTAVFIIWNYLRKYNNLYTSFLSVFSIRMFVPWGEEPHWSHSQSYLQGWMGPGVQ